MRLILGGTVRESCMVMLIIAMSFLYTYVMSYLHVTQSTAEWLIALPLSKWAFFFWVNVLLIVLGFFLPPVAIILMVTPILLPALKAHGFDLIWFGVIMTILMEMGLIHPPVGLNLFVINGIAPDIPLAEDRLGRAAVPGADGDRDRAAVRRSGDRDLAAEPLPGQVAVAAAACPGFPDARDLLGAVGEQRVGVRDALGKRRRPRRQREAAGEHAAELRQRGRIDGAGQQRDRHAGRARVLGDDAGRLAQHRLRVGPAFAGDRPIGSGERGVESDQRRDHFGAGAELGAE